jgi:hypothetical protein
MTNPQAQCPDGCEHCAKLVPCWCDPSHEPATHRVDSAMVCTSCADGVARAVPIDPAQRRTTVSAASATTQLPRSTTPASAPDAPAGAADINVARAERDRATGCMCAAELLVRGDVDRRCPLHGASTRRVG